MKKIVLILLAATLISGCATKNVEQQEYVRPVEIIERTKEMMAKRKQAELEERYKTAEEAKWQATIEQEARMIDEQASLIVTLEEPLKTKGAYLEVLEGQMILWLPERIAFDFDESKVSQEKTIEALAIFLNAKETASLKIIGHTDAVGAENYNDKLGMTRASSVAKKLAAAGVAPERFILSSKGAQEMRVQTKEAEEKNRRVDLLLAN